MLLFLICCIINNMCWPSAEHELLLKASLYQDERALQAWKSWRQRVDFDALDYGALRMVPLLFKNLQKQNIKDPIMQKYKGVYRLTWLKNQLLFRDVAKLINAFNEVGIATMILKGGALVIQYYRDLGLRPMDDFDLLVRPQDVQRAIDLLTGVKWRPKRRALGEEARKFSAVMHDFGGFENEAGRELDLHQYLLTECCYAGADDDFWDDKRAIRVQDVEAFTLNPTDHLFHICVHGVKWHAFPSLRWIADAMVILNTTLPEVNWERLLALAKDRELVLPIKDALKYLREVLDAPIPLEILQQIEAIPVSRALIRRHKARLHQRPLQAIWLYYQRYSRLSGNKGVFGFPKFLKYIWGVDNLWQVPFSLVRKGIQRLR